MFNHVRQVLRANLWLLLSAQTLVCSSADQQGYLHGRVTDTAGQPVEGAIVRVMVAPGDVLGVDPLRTAKSDASGEYRVALPLGHARCLPMEPPGGYYAPNLSMPQFATTSSAPEYELDFRLERGLPLVLELNGDWKDAHSVYLFRAEPPFHHTITTTPDRTPVTTLPPDGGTFNLSVLSAGFLPLGSAKITIDEGFRADQVASAELDDGGRSRILDEAGRVGTVDGALAAIQEGQLVLRLQRSNGGSDVPGGDKFRPLKIQGRVVDQHAQPVQEAAVRYIVSSAQSSSSTPYFTLTKADGTYELDVIVNAAIPKLGYRLAVTRDGFAGVLSEFQAISEKELVDQPPLQLGEGHTLRIRAVDPQGNPLEGAWVQPGELYLSAASFAKTDRNGECTVHNLPHDLVLFNLSHGDLLHQSKVVVAADANDSPQPVTLTLARLDQHRAVRPPAEPPPAGAPAPELTVTQWSDGKTRSLPDYRGKILVLEFWGTWCSPCVNAIPAVKAVEQKYADNPDVVLLGIHSAGTTMDQIHALQRLKDWQLPTGIDQGDSESDGVMARAYGVRGWPTQVIVDRAGKIVYNSNWQKWTPADIQRENVRITKALGMNQFPPAPSTPAAIEWSNKIAVYRLSELIDQALSNALNNAAAK